MDAEIYKGSVPVLVVHSNDYAVTVPEGTRMAMIAQVVTIQNVQLSHDRSATSEVPNHVKEMLLSEDLTTEQRLRAQKICFGVPDTRRAYYWTYRRGITRHRHGRC